MIWMISFYGPNEDTNNSRLADTIFGPRCAMFLRVRKFLSQIHQELLKYGPTTHRTDEEEPII